MHKKGQEKPTFKRAESPQLRHILKWVKHDQVRWTTSISYVYVYTQFSSKLNYPVFDNRFEKEESNMMSIYRDERTYDEGGCAYMLPKSVLKCDEEGCNPSKVGEPPPSASTPQPESEFAHGREVMDKNITSDDEGLKRVNLLIIEGKLSRRQAKKYYLRR